jgi:DNA-binding XRE family transcriptional regulator
MWDAAHPGLNYKKVVWDHIYVGRRPGEAQPPPALEDLLQRGITRERAYLAVQVGTRRHRKPWTRAQLATRAAVNLRQITQIETGERDPHFTTVIKVAKALELHALDELLGPMPFDAVIEE